MSTQLDLESLARLHARLRRPFTAREDVLRAAGVDELRLAAAQAHWSEQLTAADGGPLRDRYVAAFAGLEPPAAGPPPAAVEEPAAGVSAPPPESEPEGAAPRVLGFLQPASRQPVPSYMIGSSPLRAQPPIHPVPPMVVPTAPTPPAHVPSTAAAPPVIDVDATRPPRQRRLGSTLPFARGQDVPDAVRAAWADAKAEAQARARVPAKAGMKTTAIDATALIPSKPQPAPSTPFERASEAPPGTRIPMEEYAAFLVELAQEPSREGRVRAKYGIEGDQAQRALGAAFAAIFQRDPLERARFDALIARERAKYTPASTRLPDGVPAMSLEQFAWLSATLRATPPQDLAAVLASVRLTETTRAQLEAHWHARFEAEPALRQTFLPLLAKHSPKGGA